LIVLQNGEPLQIKTTLPSTTAQPVVYTALVSASSHGTGDDDGSDVPVSPDGEAVDQNKGKRSKVHFFYQPLNLSRLTF
jgi:hypothetical protein